METGYFLPVTPVSSAQTGSIAPALQGVSPLFTGEMSAFDLMMQQLLSGSADSPIAFQQGSVLPFGEFSFENPVVPELPFELSEDGTIDLEQLSLLISQLELQQTDMAIPQILQELKAAMEQANALGQTTVDLGAILDSATPSDITELTGFYQSTSSEGLKTLFAGIQKYFAGQEKAASAVTQEQKLVKETFEEQMKALFSQGSAPKAAEAPQPAEMLSARNVTQQDIKQQMSSPIEAALAPVQGQVMNASGTDILGQTTPEYLVPEFLKQSAVLSQGEQVLTKVVEGEFFKQNNVNEDTMRETSTIAKGLSADISNGQNSADLNMRNSLNLTTDGQGNQAATQQNFAATDSSNKLPFTFDQNLQRLQDAQSVIKQISKHVGMQEGMRTNEISMKLEPEHLGNVRINVKMQNEVINAQIIVDNESVKDLLNANMTALRSSLTDSEIKVDKVDVQVSTDAGTSSFINDAAQQGKDLTGQQDQRHQLGGSFARGLLDEDISASLQNRSILGELYKVDYLA
jgi:flagellar hook-length control protein FliK